MRRVDGARCTIGQAAALGECVPGQTVELMQARGAGQAALGGTISVILRAVPRWSGCKKAETI